MADGGAVLRFPGGKDSNLEPVVAVVNKPSPPSQPASPQSPPMDSYDYDETVTLYQIATSVKKKAEDLGSFVDQNRQVARQAGIEMIAVQVTSILEGDKFQRVVDALEDAVYRRSPISLTRDGADKVHRMERLIAEADSTIIRHMTGGSSPAMGQAAAPYQVPYTSHERPSNDASVWIPVLIMGIGGIVGVIGIIAIMALTRQPTVMPVVVSAKPSRKT